MKRVFKHFRYGQKGFTLIELLVVIAILGILAAVMVPNVGRFMGKGALEAANTEAHNVTTAVMAAMADTSTSSLVDGGTVGPGHGSSVTAAGGTPLLIEDYFTGYLQATYTLGKDGHISLAVADPDGKWKDLYYYEYQGWSDQAPEP